MYNIKLDTPELLMVDDFLPQDVWDKIYNQVQADNWTTSAVEDKYWHITDGPNYKNQKRLWSKRPFNDNMDLWLEHLEKFVVTCPSMKKFAEDYEEMSVRCHAYPVGSKNPWHTDLGMPTYTFYLHKNWEINWDSTLLVLPYDSIEYNQRMQLLEGTKQYDDYTDIGAMEMFEQSEKFKSILEYGQGTFVSPKPNRLIFINKGVVHGINRVDSDAGQNLRVSLTGFVQETKWREYPEWKNWDNE